MKAFTNLDQSKKLAEILPLESADMCYIQELLAFGKKGEYKPHVGDLIPAYGQGKIPAWSLVALLDILPETIEDECAEYDLEIDMIDKKPKYVWLGDCYHSDFPSWDWDNKELLDNIVEAVIWLNNNGYLKNEKLY